MQETLTPTEQEFARAVRANNYAEIQLSPNSVLITDWEEDGEFIPWVAVEDGEIDEEDVAEKAEDISVFEFEDVEIEDQQGVSIRFGEFTGVEFNRWAEDMVTDDEL